MRTARLYVPAPLSSGGGVMLDDERTHYLRTVLRLQLGDTITVFNGEGGEYAALITQLAKKSAAVELGAFTARETESPLQVTVGLGVSRGERMDLAVQKAVELGVMAIHPVLTERTVVRQDPQGWAQRREHWQHIVWSACEQCGRNRVPHIAPPQPYARWLTSIGPGLRLLLDPRCAHRLNDYAPAGQAVYLASGPEGGFAETERHLAQSHGFIPVRLGPRVLRTETAVVAALAALQTLWGDFLA